MCDIHAWCVVDGRCAVHRKYPLLGPLEAGHPTPSIYCGDDDAEYILQACGAPPPDEAEEYDDDDQV